MKGVACVLVFLAIILHAQSKLVGVIIVSRHGTRAPGEVVKEICPNNNVNFAKYAETYISAEGLTGNGMVQCYQLGVATRKLYVDTGFVSKYYTEDQIYVRAVSEERTMQSAVAFGQGMYPRGPKGFLTTLPAPIPVFTAPDRADSLLEMRKAECHPRLKADTVKFEQTKNKKMLAAEGAKVVAMLNEACGINVSKAVAGQKITITQGIKEITDAFVFEYLENYGTIPNMDFEKMKFVSHFAFKQLDNRLYGTPAQRVYMNGDLPARLLEDIEDAKRGVRKMWAYHGHREMTYALGKFFGIPFDFREKHPWISEGAVPPGTTVFFELHSAESSNDTEDYFVRTLLWTPCEDPETHKVDMELDCPPVPTKLNGCSSVDCPLSQFQAIVHDQFNEVGTWPALCHTPRVFVSVDSASTDGPVTVASSSWTALSSVMLIYGAAMTLVVLALLRRNSYAGYESVPSINLP